METGKDGAQVSGLDKLSVKGSENLRVAPRRPGAVKAGGEAASDGVTLEDYARKANISEAEVWRRLRRGELVGRSLKGRLIIFKSLDASTEAQGAVEDDLPKVVATALDLDLDALPPLPMDEPRAASGPGASAGAAGHYLTLSGERSGSPELALLLDHLSLAKEENREILRMTQDSMRKVTELTETIVEMKDTVIEAKDTQLSMLQEQLQASEIQIRKLRQQNEDLEMLARAVATTPLSKQPQRRS